MEVAACKRSPSRSASSSSSFRLRCPSLNSVRLRRLFDIFDKNHDGMISVQEIHHALARLGLETDLCYLDSTVNSFINPGDIGITYCRNRFSSGHEILLGGKIDVNKWF
ncbi:putative calcium-binding protein CML43 [Hibiscus syriacus]|uniref:Calcium-binding protein CML43 n=1 Tax=Hibiscus syriacus TaxID=106335 RepID=A0A6A2Z169_HIBSY|nr:putative calcium-binding protein CML43 [Hibiscus syriacus]